MKTEGRLRRRVVGSRAPSAGILAGGIVLLASAVLPIGIAAQEEYVTIQAGERYSAGGLKQLVLGRDYRELWATPVRVPVLSPDTFAGGLTPLERGGGRQTISVRFGDADGREYVFRSVDKAQGRGLHPDLHRTLVSYIVQDQVSSKHPAAAVMVAPLLEAVGILHAKPRLALLADHPSLGEFREEFAGLYGIIEERPTETEGVGPFGEYERLIGTDRLMERVEESSEDRVDDRAYLTARLMDLLLGDWDRHEDQWRWAQVDRDGRRYWLPIPRDRDNAFSSVDGLIGVVGGAVRPYVLSFEHEITNIDGLTYNGRRLDRWFLAELPAEAWDSIARSIQDRLTDDVIADAVRRQPPEYYALSGPLLEQKLRSRRDDLRRAAEEFRALLTGAIDIRGTDDDESLVVERAPDGSVEVVISGGEGGEYFRRIIPAGETREIRIDMRGGADSVLVGGAGASRPLIRVLGGGGSDLMTDRTPRGGGRVIFYDEDDDTEFELAAGTLVDQREFEMPTRDTLTQNNQPPEREWGSESSLLVPGGRWISEVGPVLTLGPEWTRFGFRRFPYARRTSVSIEVAPIDMKFGISAIYDVVRTGGDGGLRLEAGATRIDVTRFYGYGNEPFDAVVEDNRFWSDRFWGRVEVVEYLSPRTEVRFGPEIVHVDPDPDFVSEAGSAPGLRPFTLGGITATGVYDGRDSDSYPTDGAHVEASVQWMPYAQGDAPGAFARNTVVARAFHRLPLPLESVLALRGGGEAVWGTPPLQYAPAVGGSSTVRGFQTDRFRGDASLYGSAELRNRLGRINLLISRGDFGTIAVADAGRVFGEGSVFEENHWHYGFGGGVWFGPIDRKYAAHLVAVQGEGLRISVGVGMPF